LPPPPPLLGPDVPLRPREREPVLLRERELVPLERELVLRDDFAAPLERPDDGDLRVLVDLRAPPDLLAPDERLAPDPDDFARLEDDFFAPPLDRDELDRELPEPALLERFAEEREPEDLRVPLDLAEPLRAVDDDEPVLELSLGDHLPDITRCAASATASAMSEPSFAALEAMLLAACCAVSAASRPASRIFLRAAGLALIAAAAAARPAASISLLIAAFASLSTVLSLERDDDPERDEDEREPDDEDFPREELLRADLAIFYLPASGERHFRAVPVP
jgi:hypothetical protein